MSCNLLALWIFLASLTKFLTKLPFHKGIKITSTFSFFPLQSVNNFSQIWFSTSHLWFSTGTLVNSEFMTHTRQSCYICSLKQHGQNLEELVNVLHFQCLSFLKKEVFLVAFKTDASPHRPSKIRSLSIKIWSNSSHDHWPCLCMGIYVWNSDVLLILTSPPAPHGWWATRLYRTGAEAL